MKERSVNPLKRTFFALGIVGILFILFGTVFALQGNGNIRGSEMSGNSFWIYAGSGVVLIGLMVAILGFYLGSRNRTLTSVKTKGSTSQNQVVERRYPVGILTTYGI